MQTDRERRFHSSQVPEIWIERTFLIATGISAVTIVSILLLLVYFCLPLFTSGGLGEVFSWQWRPFSGRYGILPMCAGSFCLALLALVLAFPTAIGICFLAHSLAPTAVARFLTALIHFMTGIPTVIYGFVSVFLLVPRVRDWLDAGTGFTLLTAAITLSLLILPTIALVFHAGLERIDQKLKLASEAMGLTRIQQVRHILIPATSQGLLMSAILGFGRAVGDTLIALMLAGNAPQFPDSLFTSIRTLTAHIALVLATDSQSMAYQSVFAAGLILFLLMGAINIVIRGFFKSDERKAYEEHL